MTTVSLISHIATAATPADALHCDKSGGFFGLVTWYHYLPAKDFGPNVSVTTTTGGVTTTSNIIDKSFKACDLNSNFTLLPTGKGTSDIALILLAIVDDLLRVAALVAIGFVFYGAIRYITSQGNPDGTSKAQSTLINALIGLAISIVAVSAVSFIGNQLGG